MRQFLTDDGIRTVILPKRNEKDLEDVPENVRKELKFIFVDNVDEVFENALSPREGAQLRAAGQA